MNQFGEIFILPPVMTSQHSYVMTSLKNFGHFDFFFFLDSDQGSIKEVLWNV